MAVCLLAGGSALAAEKLPAASDKAGVRLIVKFKSDSPEAARKALHARLGGAFRKALFGAKQMHVVEFPPGADAAALIARYVQSELVEYAERDAIVTADPAPPKR